MCVCVCVCVCMCSPIEVFLLITRCLCGGINAQLQRTQPTTNSRNWALGSCQVRVRYSKWNETFHRAELFRVQSSPKIRLLPSFKKINRADKSLQCHSFTSFLQTETMNNSLFISAERERSFFLCCASFLPFMPFF